MWRLMIIMIGAILLVALSCCGQEFITPEQAMDAVRAFENDNTLQLECRGPEDELEGIEGPEWEHGLSYDVDVIEGTSENRGWDVNAVTGEVTDVLYYDAFPAEQTDEPLGPLTPEQCRTIAQDFARSKYVDFDIMGFQLRGQEWSDDGWLFVWGQAIAYGARTPNFVLVMVNPTDGRIEMYSSRRISIPAPQQPQITEQQAVDIGKTATGIVTLNKDPNPELRANPNGIFWSFRIRGLNADGEYHTCWVVIDAVTGMTVEVSNCDPAPFGPSPRLNSSTSGPPISLRDLAAKVPGAKVHWLGKEGARLFVGKDRYTLTPGKDAIEWTGGTIKLSQKMTLLNGRLMVPSGLLDVLKSAPAPKKAPPASAKSK